MSEHTSALIASYAEVLALINEGMEFPLIVLPFGAEKDERLTCWCFRSGGAITDPDGNGRLLIEELLQEALPLMTIPRLHVISGKGNIMWEAWEEGPFYLLST